MPVSGLEGLGNRELLLNGYGVSFQEDENVLEADRGDGSSTLNVENATELYAFTMIDFCDKYYASAGGGGALAHNPNSRW